MKNLVMGLVKGYSFEQLRPFVASLRSTGYSGDICFFYSDLTKSTLRSLAKYDVELISFRMPSINAYIKRMQPYAILNHLYTSPLNTFNTINRLFPWLVTLLSRSNKVSKCRLAANFLNVYCVRFPLYYTYLARNKDKYANVMITDVRDVIFQRDPFEFDIEEDLALFLEDGRTLIKNCPINSGWLKKGFGEPVLRQIGGNPISCSGVTFAKYDAMMLYLEQMVDQLLRLRFHGHGIDQGVHNYILYTDRLNGVRVFENGHGPVLTMGRTTDMPVVFDVNGFVVNDDGSVAHVLHQYDRHIDAGTLSFEVSNDRVRLTYAGSAACA